MRSVSKSFPLADELIGRVTGDPDLKAGRRRDPLLAFENGFGLPVQQCLTPQVSRRLFVDVRRQAGTEVGLVFGTPVIECIAGPREALAIPLAANAWSFQWAHQ